MKYEEYMSVVSEIAQLEGLLAGLPEDMVIERMGLESRLERVRARIEGVRRPSAPKKAYVTFRGKPVRDSSGIAAGFGAKALSAFSDAVKTAAAGASGELGERGRMPDRGINEPFVTGFATGSFGFELEIPDAEHGKQERFFSGNPAEKAIGNIQALLRLSSSGSDDERSDDELSVLADEIHPRAVRKIVSFLKLMHRNDAWCAIHFGGNRFQFRDAGQVKRSANRLGKNNVHESEESIRGRLQGILPQNLMFELRRLDDDVVISGKIGRKAGDSASLHRLLDKPVVARVTKVRVGRGEPRYTLRSVEYETE